MRRSRASHSTINSHRVSPSLQHRPPAAQIPIAEHAARRGPSNAPKSRFRPLAVFVRRPPAFVARFEAAGIRKPSQNLNLPHRNSNSRFSLISGHAAASSSPRSGARCQRLGQAELPPTCDSKASATLKLLSFHPKTYVERLAMTRERRHDCLLEWSNSPHLPSH
jgi:hypothetical protein